MTANLPLILIIEDEELLLKAIEKKLSLNGFETIACVSGKQAIEALSQMNKVPDAIWLDYYLKDMNGLGFMQEVRANPQWQDIPVFVVSNSADNEKVKTLLALGVSKYLLKAEYRLESIIQIIHQFINDRKKKPTHD